MASNPQEAVVLIGLQGIGKSTYCKELLKDKKYHMCSKDDLRFLVYPDDLTWEETFPHEHKIKQMHYINIWASLDMGKIPIIDETHVNKRHRAAILDHLKYHWKGIKVHAVVFPIDVQLALSRNAQREGKRRVPDNVVRDAYELLTTGLEYFVHRQAQLTIHLMNVERALKEEGFDTVTHVFDKAATS